MRLNNSRELADYLKLQRKMQSRTQTDVAEHVGLKQKTISAMENSAGSSRVDTLFKIAHELGLSVELTPVHEGDGSSAQSQWEQEW